MTNETETIYESPEPACQICGDHGYVCTGTTWSFRNEEPEDTYERCECGCEPYQSKPVYVLSDDPVMF